MDKDRDKDIYKDEGEKKPTIGDLIGEQLDDFNVQEKDEQFEEVELDMIDSENDEEIEFGMCNSDDDEENRAGFMHSNGVVEFDDGTVEINGINIDKLGLTRDQALSETQNQEAAPAFKRNLEERTIQVLTTNTLEDTFYVRKEKIKEETVETLESMAKEDPEFLAKALVYAREEGMLQLAPTLGLAILSKAEDKDYFKKVFPRIISTPDNLMKFVEICKTGDIRHGLGGVANKAVKEWLGNLTEYQALKYSGDSKSKMKDGKVVKNNFSLRDLILLARPKADSDERNERYNWLVSGHHDQEKLANNPQIAAFEELKRAETDEERIECIKKGRLPWEVVIPSVPKMTPELWQALMNEMPYMALLRNINNLDKRGILKDDANVEFVIDKLTNADAIKKAKILPFRFYEAYKAYSGIDNVYYSDLEYDEEDDETKKESVKDSRITKALEDAMELSFENMPDLPGNIAIGSDVSGSMEGLINHKGHTSYKDICGVFTGALLKKIPGRVIPLPFQDEVIDCDLSGQDRILETTKKINRLGGGGTALGAPIEKLLKNNLSVDTFVGITDNEDWAYGDKFHCGGSFLKLWREYREKVNPKAQAFLIRIDPYNDSVAPQNEPGVHFIYGWSDQVPTYIGKTLEGKEKQVEKVKNIEL